MQSFRTGLKCGAATAACLAIGVLIAHGGSVSSVSATVSFMGMRLFRDLARVKARRRRFGQKNALMPVLMGVEQPLPLADASLGLALTAEELAEYDGRPLSESASRAPLFLAIRGRIYDVSAGWSFYGPGSKYHKLVGKDATRAFCTGCLEFACLIASTEGLSAAQLQEAERWIELYEHHDKYKLVGAVREPNAAEADDGSADEAEAGSEEDKESRRQRAAEAQVAWERERVEMAQESERSKNWRPFRLR